MRPEKSKSNTPSGVSVNPRWLHSKAQFDALAKSMEDYRVWLETTLSDSSPGSRGVPVSSSSSSDSQGT
jgi:hypothetical protein